MPHNPTEQDRLYDRLRETGFRLDSAVAASRAGKSVNQDRWKGAVTELNHAVEYYTSALESYCESVLSEHLPHLARCLR